MKLWLPLVALAPLVLAQACSDPAGTPEVDASVPDVGRDSGRIVDAGRDREAVDAQDPNQAEVPVITSVSPTKSLVGAQAVDIVVVGKNFVPRTILQLDGLPLVTRFQSSTQLAATIPASAFAHTGVLHVSAGTSPPGGGASAELTISVENPLPVLTAITQPSPPSVLLGAADTPIEVQGTGFVNGSTISFGGAALTTTFGGATKLTATIPAAKLAASGIIPVTVTSPAPGGGTTTAISFTVANPQVSITSITPTSTRLGDPQAQVLVKGSGFVPQSTVSLNGTALATTYIDGGNLSAIVPTQTRAGQFPVVVQNPAPGASVSLAKLFSVDYPVPTATSISPALVVAGAPAQEITLTGTKFFAASQVIVDGTALPTTYVNATTLRATIPSAALATARTLPVQVQNPGPGGGTSSTQNFVVGNAVPVLTSLNPTGVTIGQRTTVQVNGTGFAAGAKVMLNGVAQTTTVISQTQVSFSINWPSRTALPVTVQNPAPGGGLSNSLDLGIGCDTAGVTLALANNDVVALPTAFDPAKRRASFTGDMPQQCDSAPNATVPQIDSNFTEPVFSVVVQNVTGAPMDLTTWAVCTLPKDDGYLAMYRRATVPTIYADRRACVGWVSEGIDYTSLEASYRSPEAGPSEYCPGFTKANGGQMRLDVCEKAVIYLQAYDFGGNGGYTPPATLKVKGEAVP